MSVSDLPDFTPEPAPPRSGWLDPASPRLFRHAIALLAVSISTAAFGVLFRAAASLVFHHAFHATDIVAAFEKLSPGLRVSTIFADGLLAGVVGVLAARHRSGEGVGGVMEAVALGTGAISLRASLWKALGCWVAVVTGSSVGREGPIIQFDGAIGETAGSIAKMAPDRSAALGGIFGDLLHAASQANAHAPGAYALVGMAAVCAATTHAPLMASVLVFELSGDYSIVLPLLVATAAATVVSRRIRHTSIYMDELARRGLGWKMTWSGREMNRGP